MATLALPDLTYDECGANLGGLAILKVVPWAHVVSIPDPQDLLVESSIILQPGARIAHLVFPEAAAEFSEASADNDHGLFYKPKLTVFVPKDSPVVARWVKLMAGFKHCILLYQDNNGYTKLVGTQDFPLRFSSDLEIEKNHTGKNGHTFTFAGECLEKAFFFHNIDDIGEPAAELLGDWDPRDWHPGDWQTT